MLGKYQENPPAKRFTAAGVALILLLAACTGDTTETTSPPETSPPETSPPATSAPDAGHYDTRGDRRRAQVRRDGHPHHLRRYRGSQCFLRWRLR